MPISQAVPSSTDRAVERVASTAFARFAMPEPSPSRRSPRASHVGTERELVLVRDEDLDARRRGSRAAHSSMKPRSYGVKSGPAK